MLFSTPCSGNPVARSEEPRDGQRVVPQRAEHLREVGLPVPRATQPQRPSQVADVRYARLQDCLQPEGPRQRADLQARPQLQQLL